LSRRFERLAGAAARRPLLTLAVVVGLALAGGLEALSLQPSAGIDTFVSRSSPSYRATVADERHFGDDAVIILIHEPLTALVGTGDLITLTRLEACLAGEYVVSSSRLHAYVPAPAGSHAPYGGPGSPCARLARARAAQVVYGPGTFLNRAVAAVNGEIDSLLAGVKEATSSAESAAYRLAIARRYGRARALALADAAGRLEYARELLELEQLYVGSGIRGAPSIEQPAFIDQIVFDPARGPGEPKARFAYLFPGGDSALIQVRLRASLSDVQQEQAIGWIRQAVRMPMFRSAHGGTYIVTGVPVVISDLAGEITGSIAVLLIAALAVMAAMLLLVFACPPRLAPLGIAVLAVGITFGLLAALGATLTMASIAVLPILIGLAVDYGIQLQSRVAEARERPGSPATPGERETIPRTTVPRAVGAAAPVIATAALATGTGFLVLLLSPVPMVQGFGVLLVVGIAVALGCALTAGSAVLVLAEKIPPRPAARGGSLAASLRGAAEILAPALRGARQTLAPALRGAWEILGGKRLAPAKRARRRRRRPAGLAGALGAVTRRPARVVAVAAVLALAGWVADPATPVQTDVTKLVPSSMPALRNVERLERVTGVSGEIDVTVRAADVATPRTVGWMIGYENALLRHWGRAEQRGCARATLCPALSLPDLFSGGGQPGDGGALTQARIDALLAAVPTYFSQAVITPDHREATLAFGIRLMPLARQQRVIDYMRSHLRPPPGVHAALAGLPVLAAQADSDLSSSGRRFVTLIVGLLAVGLVLALVLRTVRRAVVPMIPIALATGWSALLLYATGIPLNPMSASLGTLVIAISTEFSVLLSERYRQERLAGLAPQDALIGAYRSTGAAVLASGATAIAGFGVLVCSDITMLRDFGLVTLIDLTVSLAGVLLVLPAVLTLSERERGGRGGWGDGPAHRISSSTARFRIGRPRRRPRVA
jgi:hydrophobe/amphiphile efflux-3 (HAE3) family protein